MLMMKYTRLFHTRNDMIHVQNLRSLKVSSNVSLQKGFTKLDGLSHLFPKK